MSQKKTQKTNKFKKLMLAGVMLMMSLIALVGATWAYWNMLTQTKNETITVGEGVILQVNVADVVPAGKTLVPDDCVVDSATQVDSITLTYNVAINQGAIKAGATDLTVTISNVEIGGSETYASYVNFSINETIGDFTTALLAPDYSITITIIVTLTAPAPEDYNEIINQVITFNVNFTAA